MQVDVEGRRATLEAVLNDNLRKRQAALEDAAAAADLAEQRAALAARASELQEAASALAGLERALEAAEAQAEAAGKGLSEKRAALEGLTEAEARRAAAAAEEAKTLEALASKRAALLQVSRLTHISPRYIASYPLAISLCIALRRSLISLYITFLYRASPPCRSART